MKKICSLSLVVAMVLSLCACNLQSSTSTSTASSENSNTTSSASTSNGDSQTTSSSDSVIPDGWKDNGIFSANYEKAYAKMQTMSVDERVGQIFYANCPTDDAANIATEYQFGGYVLFGKDFEDFTKDEVIANSQSYKAATKIPMTLSVDEEGGTVVRISSNSQFGYNEFMSPQAVYGNGGLDAIKSDTVEKCNMLNSLDIDNNLAPVCDLSTNPDDFIYDRALGQDAQTTGEYVATVVKTAQENGITATLKHFPGYGNNVDTHTGIAVDERPYTQFESEDFIPFQKGIEAGAQCVLVNHNIVNCMDDTKPASLSENVHKVLRERLGFTGIIMTDDCSMDAILDYTGDADPAVIALNAGNDMVITGEYATSYPAVKTAVENGTISQDTLDHAVMRILAWKYTTGLME